MGYDQDLYERLDPKRNYGMEFDALQEMVVAGELYLSPGYKGGVMISSAQDGRRVKGSAAPAELMQQSERPYIQSRFLERAVDDFDGAYDALIYQVVEKRDLRAIRLFMEMAFGRAPEQQRPVEASLAEKILERLTEGTPSTLVTAIEIPSKQISD